MTLGSVESTLRRAKTALRTVNMTLVRIKLTLWSNEKAFQSIKPTLGSDKPVLRSKNKTLHYIKLTLRRVKETLYNGRKALNRVKQALSTVKSLFRSFNNIIGRVNPAHVCVFLALDKWNRTIKTLNKRILFPSLSPLIKERGERPVSAIFC